MKQLACCLGGLLFATGAFAQDFKMPAPSPKATVTQQFSTSKIEVSYSRPSVKGRTIFGNIVPYGKPWRTGANANTTITFGEDVSFGGQAVKAGTYNLYTIPGKDSWTVVLNSDLEGRFNTAKDVVKATVKPSKTTVASETFTIDVSDMTDNSANLNLTWENTRVTVPVKTDNKDRILAWLDTELKGDKPPYQQASYFYYDNDYQLEKALEYADKAIAANDKAYWMHSHRAKVLAKLGRKAEAIKAAQAAADLTKGSDAEYEYAKKLEELKKA